ncbi:UDP-N-acetylglucosamine--N-acetylmuramyl-(pentapeptide) pyrophosphoryl-undecaprenol N-acetylglucosamine transferase [Patescibacteria group bacterium]|nr:UDP-N-acetylglucosamine--N-acetylmuramyl-(pentapeptide) pyrophosphoryl-undecaprenol N-acetylglucosamine transferase [Patescibacteria group bacterium]MBU4458741.1 UDP-N-acetylglucosamine--N-acetylmuramyl-(pentapeptide) pyrophosphoryl-undecaprenol N-acetylglucosamine transferase [Patescibacteria group bacterium]MCG2696042.1 UDP-N-acetylglucosamine--N-acetylmuramyl-(pentapeptide) pyrophosphoryl-undecaprenol N-acetylglucosamine transferase [Candidatus Portnoybacteria bacterium]
MRILFTGGGTGGHIFPIIAIKESFQDAQEFYYLGPDGFARENLKDIKAKFITAGKFKRYFDPFFPVELAKTIVGIIQSFWHLFRWMPDVVFSKGGYGSFPVVFVAWIYRIPIVIHDSDAVPGLANKKMAKFAKRIILSFENSKKYFKAKYQSKIIVIGNPVRKELLNGDKIKAREIFKISNPSTSLGTSKSLVLILGGSQGAQKINEIITNFLPRILEIAEVIHCCGRENFKDLEKNTPKSPDYHLYPFLNAEQLKHAYAAADLIINRAGAGSIFEIAAVAKPSILIPLPNAAADHQQENAFKFANLPAGEAGTGRAIVLDQENLTPNILLEQISNLLSNPQKLFEMGQKAKSFYNSQTPELIRDEILKFAKI